MEIDSLKYQPLVWKIKIPFISSSPVDDIILLTVFTPLWWYLGVEQFIWLLGLPLITLKLLLKRRGRITLPSVGLLFFLFLVAYFFSGFAIQDFSQVDSFIRKFGVFLSAFSLLIILVNCINTWREVKSLIRAILIMMIVTSGIGALGILGLWRPEFQPPIIAFLPGWITQTSIGSFISQRVIGHPGFFLSLNYYRINSIFLFPIVYATALAVTLPLAVYKLEISKNLLSRLFWVFIFGLLFINLLYTTGRVALVGFLCGWLYYITFVQPRRLNKQQIFIVLAFLCLSLIIMFFVLSRFVPLFRSAVDALTTAVLARSTLERLSVYQYTLAEVMKRPIFGWGTETNVPGFDLPIGSHNFYLSLLYRHGFAGLITFLIMLLWLWYSVRPYHNLETNSNELISLNRFLRYGQWSIVAALVDGLGTVPTFDITTMVVLWLVFSLLVAAKRVERRMIKWELSER